MSRNSLRSHILSVPERCVDHLEVGDTVAVPYSSHTSLDLEVFVWHRTHRIITPSVRLLIHKVIYVVFRISVLIISGVHFFLAVLMVSERTQKWKVPHV